MAKLDNAELQDASLHMVQLEEASLQLADLRRAKLTRAELRNAKLDHADLREATLNDARLQGASLDEANLMGASLRGANLDGVSLSRAQLQGAVLNGARLQGASLYQAQLQGASLDEVQSQGALFDEANLEGAYITRAQPQGASLDGATLLSAYLYRAQLQGARLENVDLRFATLVSPYVWRASLKPRQEGAVRIEELEARQRQRGSECPPAPHGDREECDWTADSFTLLERLTNDLLQGDKRDRALQRIEILDPRKPLRGEEELAKAWTATAEAWHNLAKSPSSLEAYEKNLAEALGNIGPGDEGTPYAIRGLLAHIDIVLTLDSARKLAKTLLGKKIKEAKAVGDR